MRILYICILKREKNEKRTYDYITGDEALTSFIFLLKMWFALSYFDHKYTNCIFNLEET